MAVNCLVAPRVVPGLVGVTWIETSVAAVTVREVLPKIDPDVAVITGEPETKASARPFEPAALLIVATPVLFELQVTNAVISWVDPSE